MTWSSLTLLMLTLASAPQAEKDQGKKASAPADVLFAEARALTTRTEWRAAIVEFRQFLVMYSSDPRASETRFWIGYCLVKSAAYSDAALELTPFVGELAEDKWADDALLQLGHARAGQNENDKAVAAWKRLLEKYPNSVWRIEAGLLIIDSLFDAGKDYEACLSYCERVVQETDDFAAITEARYTGAYCLNALGRYPEAERWMSRWFSPDVAIEVAWREVLRIQRELKRGRGSTALAAIAPLYTEFPDLDGEQRLELTLRVASMLARENQGKRARGLLVEALRQSSDLPETKIVALLNQIENTSTADEPFQMVIDRVSTDLSLPLMTRVAVRDRQVRALRARKSSNQAEALLRDALTKERAEYVRFRAAVLLADLLAEDRDDRAEAARMLSGVLPTLQRSDLVDRVRESIARLRPAPESNSR